MWHAGSDVMGCRRPTGGVFSYVSSDRVTLRAFPVATPRGRSSSSHEGEQSLPVTMNEVSYSVMGCKPLDDIAHSGHRDIKISGDGLVTLRLSMFFHIF